MTRAGVTVDSGDLFAATTTNLLLSLNAATGALKWKASVSKGVVGNLVAYKGTQETPLVYDGRVIVGENSGDAGSRGSFALSTRQTASYCGRSTLCHRGR